ncbi:cytochrome c oxidase assembly factor 6 homolog [Coccinella septempunctata]|uniref:cytochrome c oxidase assembly factor 6 homolog n=1 Tax=Coccinella septempunctata TaxID=41139 RepID=UPI001D07A349|nr:cytochrome c oxidase assembly factor 6 homolog [Coccinella septempunctata]
MSFPNKEDRQRCWGARDKYWECLDKVGEGDQSPCAEFRKLYESSCSSQWIKHFDRKRNYLVFKNKIENEGYEPLTENNRTT